MGETTAPGRVARLTPPWRGAYWMQLGRALSRLLNALTGGEGGTTFSAFSAELALYGRGLARRWGRLRVWFIDRVLLRDPTHCARAWLWHEEHGLFTWDEAS